MNAGPSPIGPSPRSESVNPTWRGGRPGLVLVVVLLFIGSTVAAYEIGVLEGTPATRTCTGCGPWDLGMDPVNATHPAAGVYYVEVGIYPEAGLLTQMFVLNLRNSTTGPVPTGAAPASCAGPSGSSFVGFTVQNCGAPATGNWYAVLVFPNATVASVYSASSGYSWSGLIIWLSSQMEIYVISSVDQVGATLTSVGVGITIQGSCTL